MKDLKIGIVVADVEEYEPFAERIEKGKYEEYSFLGRKGHKFTVTTHNGKAEVISMLCGIGKVNATAVASHLVTIGCQIILNYGLSGGISGIRREELTLASRFVEHDFDLSGIGYKLCEKPNQEYIYSSDEGLNRLLCETVSGVKLGTAVTWDSFICDNEVRNRLKENFGAMSCDMETAAIAYVCAFGGVPFMSLRRISDDAGDEAIDSYREMIAQNKIALSDIIFDFVSVIVDKYEI